ncbi:MAG: archaeal proteasome endopeptidase complex subunit alpha [Candidatus Hodarchaeota archaeon]
MFAPRGLGYDRAITIFSPDGRLFQVEYAIEAVKRGTTAIGLKTTDGVVLGVEKRSHSPLIDPLSIQKIFRIDEHIGVAIAGLTADARVLVDHARIQAQINRLTYDETVSVNGLTKKLGALLQLYTQHAGVRPFGVSLLVAGVDEDGAPHLFMTEPSGSFWGHLAAAIGAGSQTAMEFLESEYNGSFTLEEGIELTLKALSQIAEDRLSSSMVEIALIPVVDRQFRSLSEEEISKKIKKIED